MSADWPIIELGELVNEITVGFVGSMTHEYVDDGIPFFRSKNISEYEIEWNDIRYISKEFHRRLKKSVLRSGDLVIVRTGKPGTACVIPDSVDEANCSDIVIVRVNNDKLSAHYLSYFMNSIASHQVSSHLVGAVQQHFNVGSAKKIKIPLPTRDEQEEIVKILKSLDDKRKLNRHINQTLEAMAQAIFKSWFVDFEPVKAKIAALESGEDAEGVTRAAMRAISGKTDEELDKLQAGQPEHYAQLKTTAELFPSAMQDSELGEVPERWTWKRADEMCDISIGRTPPRKESQWFSSFPDGLKWVSIRDMGRYGVFGLDTSETLTHDAVKKFNIKKVPDKTLILSFKLTVGRIAITSGEMLTNEAIAHFIQKPEINIPTSFYYLYLKQFDYNMLGSTSSIATAVNSKTIKALPIITPIEDVVGRFDVLIEPLFSQIKLVEEENRELSQLRDTLLPKLLSGELSVNAIGLVEEN